MNRRVKMGIMIALLVLAVGFAAITTTLVINGTLSIGPDKEGFDRDVIFTKAKTDGTAVITENGKTIQFTADLKDIGQESDLKYEITNKNRQYDASGTIECGFVDESNNLNEYITITPSPEAFDIEASRKKTGHVTVRMIKSFIGDDTIVDDNDPANVGEIEFKCTIKLEAGERNDLAPELPEVYADEVLNGADPVLNGDLIPISLTNDGKVIYADVYDKWYDYTTKKWANAVLLVSGSEDKYDIGDVIEEADIESYFVWIPRYKYKLWNVDSVDVSDSELTTNEAKTIEVEFENKDTEPSAGTQNGEWLTHPAFVSFDTNGMWVAKFETGYKKNVGNNTQPTNVIVKPDVTAWVSITAYNAFATSYDYKRELDSHMMKNTEWGAVAYLSHSVYGINGPVNVNNNSAMKTGYSALPTTNQTIHPGENGKSSSYNSPYNTEVGYLASTTGNITGVYDMAGGVHEAVAAYVDGAFASSGFDSTNIATYDGKYFDVYTPVTTITSYSNRILGDASGELGPFDTFISDMERKRSSWYNDFAWTPYNEKPWVLRGGDYRYGIIGGQFAFSADKGGQFSNAGFRIVLAPQ